MYTVGWLRLSPGPPIESGAEDPAEAASEEEEGDGQDEDVELQEGRAAEPEHTSVAVAEAAAPPPRCGDSSLISIWFFLGPVEMFWMLNWLNEDDSGPAADDDEDEEDEEEEEAAWEDAACRIEGGWDVVGELIGM